MFSDDSGPLRGNERFRKRWPEPDKRKFWRCKVLKNEFMLLQIWQFPFRLALWGYFGPYQEALALFRNYDSKLEISTADIASPQETPINWAGKTCRNQTGGT